MLMPRAQAFPIRSVVKQLHREGNLFRLLAVAGLNLSRDRPREACERGVLSTRAGRNHKIRSQRRNEELPGSLPSGGVWRRRRLTRDQVTGRAEGFGRSEGGHRQDQRTFDFEWKRSPGSSTRSRKRRGGPSVLCRRSLTGTGGWRGSKSAGPIRAALRGRRPNRI